MVVIAIIGVLIGLLLPAVQAAREAARRMTCTNHLKQFGLALHNYHDVFGLFPSGRGGPRYWAASGTPPTAHTLNSRWGTHLYLLPFMEQSSLYDIYTAMVESTTGGGFLGPPTTKTAGHAALPMVVNQLVTNYNSASPRPECLTAVSFFSTIIPAFTCPSDPLRNTRQTGEQTSGTWPGYAPTSYHTSRGDLYTNGFTIPEQTTATNDYTLGGGGVVRGLFGGGSRYTLADVTDGTSHTLALSESGVSKMSDLSLIRGGIAELNMGTVGVPISGTTNTPATCLGTKSPTNPKQHTTAGTQCYRGVRSFDGTIRCNGFYTILPPNSPSCAFSASDTDGSRAYLVSANSYHTGGVNAVRVDGSVFFVSDSIDCGTKLGERAAHRRIQAVGTSKDDSGPSIYGIWGAMGTISGGESKTL